MNLCDNKEINDKDENLRKRIAESVSNYVLKNFDSVVKVEKNYVPNDTECPYSALFTIEL